MMTTNRRRTWSERILAALLCITLSWTPFALTWAQPFPPAAQEAAQTFGQYRTGFAQPTLLGSNATLNPGAPGNQVVSMEELFPGMSAGAPPTNLYDNNPATASAGISAQQQLSGESSVQGDAYRAVADDARRPQGIEAQDPVFDTLDSVSASMDTFASDFSDCEPDTCAVFEGEALECKKAVGGIVNCCEEPDGIGLGSYIAMLLAMKKLDAAILGIDTAATGALGSLRGGWELMRTPFSYAGNAWDAATTWLSTGVDSITGGAVSTASEAMKGLSVEAFKQAMLNTTAEWVGQIFGAQAQAALFTNVGGTAAAGAGQGAITGGTFSLAPLIATALSVIMWAYLIYTIAMILIKIIWKCEEDEFALGVKRKLRTCHKVGSYCNLGFLGICIEKRQVYCCFNSPLARIIQEQVRNQLGLGWGSAENPDCDGLTTDVLSAVDWSRVDLGEWLGMLQQTGFLPDPTNITMDNLTGSGNPMNDGSRQNTADRTQQRLQGIDSNSVRAEGAADFQGVIP